MSANLQDLVDGMSARFQRERSTTQMTLGKLIDVLETMPPEFLIDGIEQPHSYRGYYEDLAFERAALSRSVADTLAMCREAMVEVFSGYKGGDYQMGKLSPIWLAEYGSCGVKLILIRDDGTFETAQDA